MTDQPNLAHCKISGWSDSVVVSQLAEHVRPTAKAVSSGSTARPARNVLPELGLAIGDQADPFQRRISARSVSAEVLPHEAMHDEPAAQAVPAGADWMPYRVAVLPRLGLGTRDQPDPFQRKISVRNAGAGAPQSATQSQPAAHAVPAGPVLMACRPAVIPGVGLWTTNHAVPFQRMARVRTAGRELAQLEAQYQPAAHAIPPGPAFTARRTAPPPGLGLATADQAEPSQRKTSARRPAGDQQRDAHDHPTAQAPPGPWLTPYSRAARPGLGLGTRDQADPFQRKIRVRSASAPVWQPETQVHPTAHAVPSGPLLIARRTETLPGLGLATVDQEDPRQRMISVR